jgi:hypothetical protein
MTTAKGRRGSPPTGTLTPRPTGGLLNGRKVQTFERVALADGESAPSAVPVPKFLPGAVVDRPAAVSSSSDVIHAHSGARLSAASGGTRGAGGTRSRREPLYCLAIELGVGLNGWPLPRIRPESDGWSCSQLFPRATDCILLATDGHRRGILWRLSSRGGHRCFDYPRPPAAGLHGRGGLLACLWRSPRCSADRCSEEAALLVRQSVTAPWAVPGDLPTAHRCCAVTNRPPRRARRVGAQPFPTL